MDNKEAAEVIAAMRKHEIDILKINALELAIKALEQEPDAIHNEREQAYMKGYEDASKRYRTEPCDDAISRSEAIRVASGYCHWSNIPDELAKLPSVNPIPCEDAISRQEAIDVINTAWTIDDLDNLKNAMITDMIKELPSVGTEKTGRWIFVDKAKEHAHCSECDYGNVDLFDGRPHNYCPNCGARMETQEEYESCKGCPNICIMYDPDMKGCKDKMEEVEE